MEEQEYDLKKYILIGSALVIIFVIGSYFALKTVFVDRKASDEKAKLYQNLAVDTQDGKKTMQEPTGSKSYASAPKMQIDLTKKYTATLNTTKGAVMVELNANMVPQTVNNFVFLAREKFYDGVVFHRIIKGFMIQTGDPTGTGSGGPGYKFADEKFNGSYDAGIVAMANAGPNTNGSQFFIMHKSNDLPKNYTIFGKVTDEASLKVIDAIANTPVTGNQFGELSSPTEKVVISSITIAEM